MTDEQSPCRQRWAGRTALYDTHRVVHAWELLSDSQETLRYAIDRAGAAVLSDELPIVLPPTADLNGRIAPEQIILAFSAQSPLIARLRNFRQLGYRTCVDARDAADAPEADFVRIDATQCTAAEIRLAVRGARESHRQSVVANLRDSADFANAQSSGADLFMGALIRPAAGVQSKAIPTSRLASLRLLAQCQTSNITVGQLAETISTDSALTYGLLRLANTLLYSRSRPMETLADVVRRLGTQMVMRWTILLTVASQQDCPTAYLRLSLERAYMCEQVGEQAGIDPEGAFLAGLLSLIDSIMQMPMTTLLRSVCLAPDVVSALVDQGGKLAPVLRAVRAWECGPPSDGAEHLDIWLAAIARGRETFRSLLDVAHTGPAKNFENIVLTDALH